MEGHISHIKIDHNDFKDLERFKKEVLIERAVKTTITIFYRKGLFDDYGKANEVFKD